MKGAGRAAVLAALLLAGAGFAEVKRYVPPTPEQMEAELVERINQERALLRRPPLLPHPFLREIARRHSARMAAAGALSHRFPGWPDPEQRMQEAGLCFLASAENIAHGQSPYARFVHEALMASVRHRINILDARMRQVGVGVVRSGSDYYVSEEFAAIVGCPVDEEVMVRVENELWRWCRDQHGRSLVIISEARLPARISAQMHLRGIPFSLDPFSDRKMRGVTVCYNDLDLVLAELKTEIHANAQGMAVGVFWGRNAAFPGGAYSVCLLLFE